MDAARNDDDTDQLQIEGAGESTSFVRLIAQVLLVDRGFPIQGIVVAEDMSALDTRMYPEATDLQTTPRKVSVAGKTYFRADGPPLVAVSATLFQSPLGPIEWIIPLLHEFGHVELGEAADRPLNLFERIGAYAANEFRADKLSYSSYERLAEIGVQFRDQTGRTYDAADMYKTYVRDLIRTPIAEVRSLLDEAYEAGLLDPSPLDVLIRIYNVLHDHVTCCAHVAATGENALRDGIIDLRLSASEFSYIANLESGIARGDIGAIAEAIRESMALAGYSDLGLGAMTIDMVG